MLQEADDEEGEAAKIALGRNFQEQGIYRKNKLRHKTSWQKREKEEVKDWMFGRVHKNL